MPRPARAAQDNVRPLVGVSQRRQVMLENPRDVRHKIASATMIDPHRPRRERLGELAAEPGREINPHGGTTDWYFASMARPARTPVAPHQRKRVGVFSAFSKHQLSR
jgi:hypothetical protein